jgi:hypothetical protein
LILRALRFVDDFGSHGSSLAGSLVFVMGGGRKLLSLFQKYRLRRIIG